MTNNLTIITIISSSLFLSACETASQKVVSSSAETSKGSSSSVASSSKSSKAGKSLFGQTQANSCR